MTTPAAAVALITDTPTCLLLVGCSVVVVVVAGGGSGSGGGGAGGGGAAADHHGIDNKERVIIYERIAREKDKGENPHLRIFLSLWRFSVLLPAATHTHKTHSTQNHHPIGQLL